MSKVYILVEEIHDFNIQFEYYLIGVYSDKELAIQNCIKLFNDTTSKINKAFKVLEYPINTPIDFIDSDISNIIMYLASYD